jgi:hypothetical protein
MLRPLRRLATLSPVELQFRIAEAARAGTEALRVASGGARWRSQQLADRLNLLSPDLEEASVAIRAGDDRRAHAALAAHFLARDSRFPLDPRRREAVSAFIGAQFPLAREQARRRADHFAEGRYDLLGYSGLSFRTADAEVDWHFDPVHGRRAPAGFWRRVPFLDPLSGDHKIIWELNRHQHWLAFGRAAWLTGDARYAKAFVRELRSWMRANPPLVGINWASMLELSFRSISWVWALHFFVGEDHPSDAGWLVELLLGLDRQLDHVSRHLSTYFSPNTHLLGEALALYVAGQALPELSASSRWAQTGRDVLLHEATIQVCADGGHAERSPHYHRYALDFYLLALTVARRTGDSAADSFAATVARLATFCRAIADDEGRLARIGDDDGGALFPICGRDVADASDSLALAAALLQQPALAVSAPPEEVLWMLGGERSAGHPSEAGPAAASRLFEETGYAVLRSAQGHAIVDVGRHGFLNGGHAHADALSLVLTVRGVPLLIDPGTATYTMDAAVRDRFRSSAMHNTVVIDGRSQSEPRGPFHWRTQAHAAPDRWRPARTFDYVEASHDGYAPLRHRRGVLATGDGLWIVADHLLGGGSHRAEIYWHLDPRWQPTASQRGAAFAASADTASGVTHAAFASNASLVECFRGDPEGLGWWSPVYGRLEPALTLRLAADIAGPTTLVTVIAASELPAALDVAPLEFDIQDQAGTDSSSRAWHVAAVSVAGRDDRHVVAFATAVHAGRTTAPVYRVETEFGTLVSDAHVTFLRLSARGEPVSIVIVDGMGVRWTGPGAFAIDLPSPAEDLHLDLAGERRLSRPAGSQPLG